MLPDDTTTNTACGNAVSARGEFELSGTKPGKRADVASVGLEEKPRDATAATGAEEKREEGKKKEEERKKGEEKKKEGEKRPENKKVVEGKDRKAGERKRRRDELWRKRQEKREREREAARNSREEPTNAEAMMVRDVEWSEEREGLPKDGEETNPKEGEEGNGLDREEVRAVEKSRTEGHPQFEPTSVSVPTTTKEKIVSVHGQGAIPKRTEKRVRTIFESPQDYLLDMPQPGEGVIYDETRPMCPEVPIGLEGVLASALVDSGSEVSCISEEFYSQNLEVFRNCPTLPVTSINVVGAFGGGSGRIKQQMMATAKVYDSEGDVTLLVVPKLQRSVLLGIDGMDRLGVYVDTHKKVIKVRERIVGRLVGGYWQMEESPCGIPEVNKKMGERRAMLARAEGTGEEEEPEVEAMRQVMSGEIRDPASECLREAEVDEKLRECADVDMETQKGFKELVFAYRDIFRKRPGRMQAYEHRLVLKDEKPFVSRSYPVPMAYRGKVTEEINKMLAQGVIQRSTSTYINPLVTVIKTNGDVRLCLDARLLNEHLEGDYDSALPTEEIFQKCGGAKVMSTLDLTSSFWQIPLHPDSRKYTAFRHENKCYEFTVTPFGLKTSTAALVRGLDIVLRNTGDFIVNFVDDLLVVSADTRQHLQHLQQLFSRIREHGMTLKMEKSHFFRKEVNFLGHVVTTKGILPQPDKVKSIKEFPRPRNIKQLRGFLGLVNFYTKFTSKHAAETIPLLELLKKGTSWKWTDIHETAFGKVKQLFCESVVLEHPDVTKPYTLATDASDYALGATLSQTDENGEVGVISFASRTLKGAEVGYTTSEKELLAIVWALQKFQSYLKGAKITVITDHKALTFLKTCRFTSDRLLRWALLLQGYDLTVEHRPGKSNQVADTLSRLRDHTYEPEGTAPGKIVLAALAKKPSSILSQKMRQIATLQRNQEDMGSIINLLKDEKDTKTHPKNYRMKDGVLQKAAKTGQWKVALPEEVREILVEECHVMYGHIGATKVFQMLNEDFAYPRFARTIRHQLASCDTCQRTKCAVQNSYANMQTIVPEGPGDLLSIDFYGPLPVSTGRVRHILVTLDAFTKYVALYPMQKANTKTVIKKLSMDYIPKYGKPRRIQFDHGTQFTAKAWKKWLQDEGIRGVFSSIRHPQGNIVERVNRELGRFFRTLLTDRHTAWAKWVPVIQDCINESPHDTTEYTPMELQTKKQPHRPWKNWIPALQEKAEILEEYGKKLEKAQLRIIRKGRRRAEKFDECHRMTTYEEGDMVLVKALNVSNQNDQVAAKFMPLYEGPYRIGQCVGLATYSLEDPKTKKIRGKFHSSLLKKYREKMDIKQPAESEEEEEYPG